MAKINSFWFGQMPFLPNVAQLPVNETLEFLTDQMLSYNGKEQNIQLRSKARQTFRYELPLQASAMAAAFNTGYGAIRASMWAVPQWTDAQYAGNVPLNAFTINCDTTHYDLRPQSMAMLYDGCGNWQVVDIDTVTETGITLVSGTTQAYRGAMLIPVRRGFITDNFNRNSNGFKGNVSLTFQVQDLKEVVVSAPTQFLGNDIYFDAGLLDGEFESMQFRKRQDIIDFSLGLVQTRTPWTMTKVARNYRNLSFTPAERKQFRDFIFRRYGKTVPFWLPTFTHDIRITNTGTIVSTLNAPRDSYIDYASARTHVAIEAGGIWYPRTISSVTPTSGDTMQLALSSPLNVPASSVTRVSYLGLNRLDADTIEFNHNDPKSVESVVSIIETSP